MQRISWIVIFFACAACSSNNPTTTDGGPDASDEGSMGIDGGTCMTVSAVGISAGGTHACARKADGTMLCWGVNNSGETGDGTTDGEPCLALTSACRMTPVATKIGSVADVSSGDGYTCVKKADGTLWCFGTNGYAELGDGTIGGPECMGRCRVAPAQVAVGTVISFSTAQQHACAVKTDGTAWCWGVNGNAQLGDGTTTGDMCGGLQCRKAPVQVVGLTDVAEVSAGYVHSCARKNDGTVWCWGDDNNGQLGDGQMGSPYRSMAVQAGISSVAQIGVGDSFTCARKNDGTVWCWGGSQDGNLGTGSTTDIATPVQVTSLGSSVAKLSVGRYSTCALKNDGTAWCWGRAIYGQIGSGNTKGSGCGGNCEPTPVQVTALGTETAEISVAGDFACARKKDGTVMCWGNRMTGELGIGTFHNNFSCGNTYCEPAPVPVCQ